MDPPLKQDSNQSGRTVTETGTIKEMFNCFIDGTEKEFEDLKMQLKEYEERSALEIERSLNLCKKNADLESKLCDCESKLSKIQEEKLKICDELATIQIKIQSQSVELTENDLKKKELDELKAERKTLLEKLTTSNKHNHIYFAKLQDARKDHEQEKLAVAQLTTVLQEALKQYDQKIADNVELQQQLDTMQQEMVTKLDQKVTQVLNMRNKLKRAHTLLRKRELEYSKEREETLTAYWKLSDELKWKNHTMANQANTFIQDINQFANRCKAKYNKKKVATATYADHPPEKRSRMTIDVTGSTNPENKPQTTMWSLENLNVFEKPPSFQDDNMMSK